ncbi:MAG: hypothetical protein AAGA66_18960, partial [Bacteroidota bacterium]
MRLVSIFLLVTLYFNAQSQNFSTDDVRLIMAMDELFKANHIDYQKLMSELKNRFPDQLLSELDPEANYLTEIEAKKIRELLSTFDLKEANTRGRLEGIRELFELRLRTTKEMLSSISKMDFYQKDSVLLNQKKDSIVFSVNNEALKNRWIRSLKFDVLLKHTKDSSLIGKTEAQINTSLNQQFSFQLASSICYLDHLVSNDRELTNYVLHSYLKAYGKSFDPHSNYLSPQEESSFNTNLSSESYGTGIQIEKRGNKLFVTNIIPLSYASFNKHINVGDEITGVLMDDRMISPACLSEERLIEFFYGDHSGEIKFELKSSKDFQYRNMKLQKSFVDNSFNHT